jgi:hypothetical protein
MAKSLLLDLTVKQKKSVPTWLRQKRNSQGSWDSCFTGESKKMKFKRHEGGYSYISEDGKWIIMSTGNGGQLAWSVRTTENPHYSLWYSATIAGCKDLIDSHN